MANPLCYGCPSVDYGSEVNSHVAKLLLLWEPLMLKFLPGAGKIRARSTRPRWLLLAAQRSSCAAVRVAASHPHPQPGDLGTSRVSFPSLLLPSLLKVLARGGKE